MKKLNKIIIITLLAVLCACSDDDNKPNDNNNYFEFEFLKVGNKWEYEISYYDTNGNFISKNDRIYEITAMKKYDGEAGWDNEFVVNDGFNNFYENENSLTCNPSSGFDYEFPTIYKNYYKGQKWEYEPYDRIREVLSINETVTVPAGIFSNCIKIGEGNGVYYISPKYGLITKEFYAYFEDNDVTVFGKIVKQLVSKNF